MDERARQVNGLWNAYTNGEVTWLELLPAIVRLAPPPDDVQAFLEALPPDLPPALLDWASWRVVSNPNARCLIVGAFLERV